MTLPEEAILIRAVKDALAFTEDSQRNNLKTLYEESLDAASEDSGVQLEGKQVSKLYARVFSAAVSALVEWDFDTDFDHAL